jgi:ATP-dependent DNA helicase RecQ
MGDVIDLKTSLNHYFGYPEFRNGQERAIQAVIEKKNTLVVLPTGTGKSLCYQLPAMLQSGLTMVVSPLIALMKDQVDDLDKRRLPATFINSSISPDEQNRRLLQVAQKKIKILYVAPERFRVNSFMTFLDELNISLLAVDEAHCISFWGHDFRPDYLLIKDVIKKLGDPVVLALTATATKQVQSDILKQLGLVRAEKIVTGFNRPNLTFRVFEAADEADKLDYVNEFIIPKIGSAIIYVGTRKKAEEIAIFVDEECRIKSAAYHAGMSSEERTRVQNDFMRNKVKVIVATNAFGMGVDKPDVRLVLHYSLPGTLESYYQEAGRAGRDGKRSGCVLLYNSMDCELQEWFIENSSPTLIELSSLYSVLKTMAVDRKVTVSLDELQYRAGMDNVKIPVCLRHLEAAGAVLNQGSERGVFTIEIKPLNQAKLIEISQVISERRLYKFQMLQQMVDYAESTQCRRRIILDHFGDPAKPEAIICCDNCQAREHIRLKHRKGSGDARAKTR